MKMRIIVLQGMPNKGKTRTLNLVYNLLVPNNGGVSTNRQVIGNPTQNDFSDIVIRDNQRIAFFTMGDYSTPLARAIFEFDQLDCDILVCALSTNTPKVRANNALNQYNTTRLNKSVATNSTSELNANNADAQTIFNLL